MFPYHRPAAFSHPLVTRRSWSLRALLCIAVASFSTLSGVAAEVAQAMKQDFENRVRAALQQPDPSAWLALRHSAGVVPDKERDELEKTLTWEPLRAGGGKVKISFVPPSPEHLQEQIGHGKRFRPNLPIVIAAEIEPDPQPANGSNSTNLALVIHDGKLMIVGTLMEDLGWKGPADRSLHVTLFAKDATDDFRCEVEVHSNSSGVPQTKRFALAGKKTRDADTVNSIGYWGQEIHKILVRPSAGSAKIDGWVIVGSGDDRLAIPPTAVSTGSETVVWPASAR